MDAKIQLVLGFFCVTGMLQVCYRCLAPVTIMKWLYLNEGGLEYDGGKGLEGYV